MPPHQVAQPAQDGRDFPQRLGLACEPDEPTAEENNYQDDKDGHRERRAKNQHDNSATSRRT